MQNLSGDVLGVTYFGPVEGSPLFPPDLVTLYFALFLLLLAIIYLALRIKGQEIGIRDRLKKIFWLGVVIKTFVLIGGGLLAAYWFIPAPNVIKTTPAVNSELVSPNHKIEIVFDRP